MENNNSILTKVKSNYIAKKILSPVIEYIKLGLINYNKELQKKLNVSIEDYKKRCKVKKIGQINGKGKEYDLFTNKLIFEGEYINGKRNGRGKEYNYFSETKFIGEYLNGKIIKGKGYNNDGDVIFILKRNGKGKEYYKTGELLFEGKYLNGKRWNGKGFDKLGNKKFIIKNGKGWGKQ